MVVRFAGATCTLTTGPRFAASWEQPDRPAAASTAQHSNGAMRFHVRSSMIILSPGELEGPGQRLQVGERDSIPRFSVVIGVARLHQRVLCIHHFQRRCLTRLVT